MNEIEYICISDIHLGAYNSLFSSIGENEKVNFNKTPPVLRGLIDILKNFIIELKQSKKPKFILNGDIFELAQANMNESVMAFDLFLREVYDTNGKKIFSDKIIFIPGNHDHHLWETARETQYLEFLKKIPPTDSIPPPWHHTKIINGTPLKSKFLTGIMRRHHRLNKGRAIIAYPNFVLNDKLNYKSIVITHGHFIESIYRLMSTIQSICFPNNISDETIDSIEKENFAWIDFLWSMLGRSGKVGESVGLVYDMYLNNSSLELLAHRLIQYLLSTEINKNIVQLIDPFVKLIIQQISNEIMNRERFLSDKLLGDDASEGLDWYISKPLKYQFMKENNSILPKKMSFLFGHTHKPFLQTRNGYSKFGYPESIEIINSGGWIIDSIEPKPLFGGSVILIDNNKNCYHLNLFKETSNNPSLEISNQNDNEILYFNLLKIMKNKKEIFEKFQNDLFKEIEVRRRLVSNRVQITR